MIIIHKMGQSQFKAIFHCYVPTEHSYTCNHLMLTIGRTNINSDTKIFSPLNKQFYADITNKDKKPLLKYTAKKWKQVQN